MAKLPIDLKGFKKVASDENCTTLRHPRGHEIKIAHFAVNPKTKSALDALPIHKAEGGEIKKKSAYVDTTTSGIGWVDRAANAVEHALTGKDPEPKPSTKPKQPGLGDSQGAPGYAQGGPVKMYADGTPDAPVSDSTQPAASPPAAPIVINVGQQPQIPAALANPTPGAQAMAAQAQQPQVTQHNPLDVGSDAPYGVTPEGMAQAAATATQPAPEAPQSAPSRLAPPIPPSAAPSDPYGTQAQMDAFGKGAGEYKAGLAQQAAAESQASQGQAKALGEDIAQRKTAQQIYQEHYNELDRERKAFQQDLQNQHIDPQHYWNSKSTASKVSTAIGLILGGIGGGMTHQENPAMKFLQSNIERDIEAQKAELGKKENLLSANLKQFGNMRDATDMTRIMQNDIVSSEFKEAAAKAGSAEAKAKMLIEAGKWDAQNAAAIGQMTMRKTLLSGMQSGQVDPGRVVMALVPKEQQHAAYEELQKAQNTVRAKDNILSAFDQLEQLNTVGNRVGSPLQTPRQVSALRDPIIAGLSKETAGRFTESDAKMVGSLFPAAGDNADTINRKRSALNKLISEKMNFPMLQSYGINVGNMGRFSPQGQSRIQERPPVTK